MAALAPGEVRHRFVGQCLHQISLLSDKFVPACAIFMDKLVFLAYEALLDDLLAVLNVDRIVAIGCVAKERVFHVIIQSPIDDSDGLLDAAILHHRQRILGDKKVAAIVALYRGLHHSALEKYLIILHSRLTVRIDCM